MQDLAKSVNIVNQNTPSRSVLQSGNSGTKSTFSLNLKKPKVNANNIKEFLSASKANKNLLSNTQLKLLNGKFRSATPNKQVRFINYAAAVQNNAITTKAQSTQ